MRSQDDGGRGSSGSIVGLLSHHGIFVPDECLSMELERLAHELGDTSRNVSSVGKTDQSMQNSPPDNHFINHTTPKSSNSTAQLLTKAIDSIIVKEATQLLVHDLLLISGWFLVVFNTP